MKTSTKIIIGLSAGLFIATVIAVWQVFESGRDAGRAEQAERLAAQHEKLKLEAIARADSFQQLHMEAMEVYERQKKYSDSIVQNLERFGNRIVLIREYENDSIVGSFDLSKHLKLFTEWRDAAKTSHLN